MLEVFSTLPLAERLFVRARLWSAPLAELERRAPAGRIADVGCGHGVLSALLAQGGKARTVLGIDPDATKIAWAQASVGRLPNARFEVATVEQLAAREQGAFDAVTVADVLYLLPLEGWPAFLSACRTLLKPGGLLLLKEAEANGSWRHRKTLLQEQVMVRLLGRTRDSGGLHFEPRGVLREQVEAAGLKVEGVLPLEKGYTTSHVLLTAVCG